ELPICTRDVIGPKPRHIDRHSTAALDDSMLEIVTNVGVPVVCRRGPDVAEVAYVGESAYVRPPDHCWSFAHRAAPTRRASGVRGVVTAGLVLPALRSRALARTVDGTRDDDDRPDPADWRKLEPEQAEAIEEAVANIISMIDR